MIGRPRAPFIKNGWLKIETENITSRKTLLKQQNRCHTCTIFFYKIEKIFLNVRPKCKFISPTMALCKWKSSPGTLTIITALFMVPKEKGTPIGKIPYRKTSKVPPHRKGDEPKCHSFGDFNVRKITRNQRNSS